MSEGPWEKESHCGFIAGLGPQATSQRPSHWRRRGIGGGKVSGGRYIKLLQNFIE